MDKAYLSKWFQIFAEKECRHSSLLYEWLSLRISEDDELLELSRFARKGQPVPNLFLGAVHYLLLKGADHPLRRYYPSIVENVKSYEESFPFFKEFCKLYKEEILVLIKDKLVQTNEVRRCGYLYPVFSYIHNKCKKPLALIEIGTSAGFQLLWDKYKYTYNGQDFYGDSSSTFLIQTEIKSEAKPELLRESPPVSSRMGLDLHINDVTDVEDALWLNALIWPEHGERRALFKSATEYMNRYKSEVVFVEGDGVELLDQIAADISLESTLCVFHTHVANQMPNEVKQKLLDQISKIGQVRDIFHLYNNIWDSKLNLDSYINGEELARVVGETDGHGKWFTWEL